MYIYCHLKCCEKFNDKIKFIHSKHFTKRHLGILNNFQNYLFFSALYSIYKINI